MPNPCIFCRADCCRTYTITITLFDLARILKKSKEKNIIALIEPRLLSYDPDNVFDTTDDYGYYLLGLKSHPCVFLNTKNQCKIHKFAPLSCRRYPFNVQGKLNTRFCPLASQILSRLNGPDIKSDQLVQELSEHKELVKKWNKNPKTKKELLKFIVKVAGQLEV
ncbi:Putative zinc- or iron-chelating domain protein [Candidatus Bilamarchaeum dharawalense]|uniref:Zinc- or iron-chelating domain protein n=1 Tax=Candidatus Bilamarchaeum dharawalense TaxID=2885759 RepID=A0A5E4LQS2_9ARCH|nr:Putative zinc- or iron-chelating domain protein [Candidatus Bilamarchaeum dharawalense]